MLPLGFEPNITHKKLAQWEQEGKLLAVITQNIDGSHRKGGSRRVYELHGSVLRNYCEKCGRFYPAEYVKDAAGVPLCRCGGIVKPDVVLYEESLNEKTLADSVSAIEKADLFIVAGTSLTVYPAAGLIRFYREVAWCSSIGMRRPTTVTPTWCFTRAWGTCFPICDGKAPRGTRIKSEGNKGAVS